MIKIYHGILLTFLIQLNASFLDLNELQNNINQWKNLNVGTYSEVRSAIPILDLKIGASSSGFDFSDVKNKILQWKTQKLSALCPTNGANLQNLLNLACSTAQPSNVTLRDSCISCFSQATAMTEGPEELTVLANCAIKYFTNTSYSGCAIAVITLATSALNVQPSGCYMGYCDFVRCVRRTNSQNLITQCTREARTGVNITLDADNVRFYKNVTSCLLAKSRCGTFNPITGEPQVPGYLSSSIKASNALQFSETGELRIIAFSANTPVTNSFCSATRNLTQTNWLTNVC